MINLYTLAQQAVPAQEAPGDLMHTLMTANEEVIVPMVVFVSIVLIVAIVTTARTVSAISRRRIDAALKQDMLDRGMTADEIAMVIQASPDTHAGARPPQPNA